MSDTDFTVVIPARYDSSRFPGKVLADLEGRPMLQWVHERAARSGAARTLIATDDERVRAAAEGFGAEVLISAAPHGSGSERVREAALALGLADAAVVVNVQADEPMIPPPVIAQVAETLRARPDLEMASLYEPLEDEGEAADVNVVKVVCDAEERALYFSRAPIPRRGAWRRHIGVYGYRVSLLRRWLELPRSPLEEAEGLEQLRALANGVAIAMAAACEPTPAGVDTPEELRKLRGE